MDELRYRFPGEAFVVLKGSFSEVNSFEGLQGFILTDHSGNKKYLFQEGVVSEKPQETVAMPRVLSQEEYLERGNQFLSNLKAQGIEKAVFSRIKQVTLGIDPELAFELLEKAYPSSFVYLIRSQKLGTWIGASPEVLANFMNGTFFTVALAGTLPADSTEEWTEKEAREQQAVTDFIQDTASNFSQHIQVSERKEIVAGPVRHLRTEITFPLDQEKFWDLIALLHPTPAVSGLPVDSALGLIRAHEAHDRKLYTGYLGLIEEARVRLFVNLRCGEWIEDQFYLYLGGGYNDRSMVEKEWEETENKSRTLLNILQKGSFDQ